MHMQVIDITSYIKYKLVSHNENFPKYFCFNTLEIGKYCEFLLTVIDVLVEKNSH